MSNWPTWSRPILSRPFAQPEKGAVPLFYLATAKEVREKEDKFGGIYFNGCKLQLPSKNGRDLSKAKNLWDLSETAAKSYLIDAERWIDKKWPQKTAIVVWSSDARCKVQGVSDSALPEIK